MRKGGTVRTVFICWSFRKRIQTSPTRRPATKEMVKRLASIRPRHALTIVCLLPRAEASSNLRRHSFCCRFEEEERGRGGGESLARGVRKLTAATRGARAPEPVGAEQLGEGVLTLPPLRSAATSATSRERMVLHPAPPPPPPPPTPPTLPRPSPPPPSLPCQYSRRRQTSRTASPGATRAPG